MKDQKGQSLVELAIVLPILLLILMGMIEFGRVFNAGLTLQNLSREGARYGATGASDSQITDILLENAKTLGSNAHITVTIVPGQGKRNRGEQITVKVDYAISLLSPFSGTFIQNPYPLSAQTTMRIE